MRRLWIALVPVVMLSLAGPAAAQTAVEKAAQSLRSDPVYVDSGAEQAITAGAADDIRSRIRKGSTSIFVAVLPGSAAADAGGSASEVAATLARQVGLKGTYAVVVGKSFQAGSTVLPSGAAAALAQTSLNRRGEGTAVVLSDFVDRVQQAPAARSSGSDRGSTSGSTSSKSSDSGGVSSGTVVFLALLGLGGGGLFFWSRKRRIQRQKKEAEEEAAERRQLDAELSVLSEDVLALESEVTLHPDARADYDAGVSRHQAAQAAMGHTGDKVDLVRVGRVIEEGRYAMSRARARIDGREPPPPPPQLTQPGRRNEPALGVDDQGAPAYVGYTGPFYGGGGWYGGGGSGLFTGLMLGQMMGGGWGYGYGGGYGGGYYGDRDDDDRNGGDDGGDGDGGGDFGGGDFGGDFGGGDFGGGDFGGGDFGGGDFGGGDFG